MRNRAQWDTTKIHRGYYNNPHGHYHQYCPGLCVGLKCLACWTYNYPGKKSVTDYWSLSIYDLLFYFKKNKYVNIKGGLYDRRL